MPDRDYISSLQHSEFLQTRLLSDYLQWSNQRCWILGKLPFLSSRLLLIPIALRLMLFNMLSIFTTHTYSTFRNACYRHWHASDCHAQPWSGSVLFCVKWIFIGGHRYFKCQFSAKSTVFRPALKKKNLFSKVKFKFKIRGSRPREISKKNMRQVLEQQKFLASINFPVGLFWHTALLTLIRSNFAQCWGKTTQIVWLIV